MDNKDFDKLFSDQLGQEQDFGFREADWTDLDERMAAQQGNRRRFIFPFWLAAAGSILLLGGIFYLWYANRLTNHEVAELRAEIAKLQEGKSTDTVYQEIVVYKKDTVFVNSNNPNSTIQDNLSKEQVAGQNLKTGSNKFQQNPLVDQGFPVAPKNALSKEELQTIQNNSNQALASEEQKQTLNNGEFDEFLTAGLEYIPIFAEAHFKMPELDIPLIFVKQKPAKKQIKLDIGAQFDLSAGAGYVAVKTSDSDDEAIIDPVSNPVGNSATTNIVKRNSVTAGIQGELTFNDKFRLTSGIYYERLNLDVENYRAVENIPGAGTISVDVDPTTYNVEDYRNAAVLQQTLNYDFGVKYVFESKNKWRPYLGTAILGQSNLKRNIEYVVDSNSLTTNDLSENLRAATANTQPVFFYGIRTTIGTEYSISEHFGLHAEGNYNYAFRAFEDRHLTLFGLRAGVYFKF